MTIHYDKSGYGNPPERTVEPCPQCNGTGERSNLRPMEFLLAWCLLAVVGTVVVVLVKLAVG